MADPFGDFDVVIEARRKEADEFYAAVIPASLDADAANVMRQALAGMLWSKQFYYYDVNRWLDERGADPFEPGSRSGQRNEHWDHMYNANIVSMPDKWEYPWYAAWDLAFHVVALTLVDEDFGKQQLNLMLHNTYIHPSGQLPAYEWNFGDVNPPVHAFSTIFTYKLEVAKRGQGDLEWLERQLSQAAPQLHVVGQPQGPVGQQCIRGRIPGPRQHRRLRPQCAAADWRVSGASRWHCMDGFLLPEHARDRGCALGRARPIYSDMCLKFRRAFSPDRKRPCPCGARARGCGTRQDGFFYDVLRLPDGRSQRLKVRSMVGLLPLCAVTVFDGKFLERHPEVRARFRAFLEERPELKTFIHDPAKLGHAGRRLASALDETKAAPGFGDNAGRE